MLNRVGHRIYNNPYWDPRLSTIAIGSPIQAVSAITKTVPIIDPPRYPFSPTEDQGSKPSIPWSPPTSTSSKQTVDPRKNETMLDGKSLAIDYHELQEVIAEQMEEETVTDHGSGSIHQKMHQYMFFIDNGAIEPPHQGEAGKYLNFFI
ncbi:hypothetical protein [Heliorestis convoluta]|uniref:Uncharacterized protein n=1 Tax=Heliorestis convoluta TaxID=356322 RepID=A0A5Q2N4K4_9FIRM|nr:hypothetical protein [Heliorestis convoluta]QGG47505.1 hypothetical protein FTV88_1358 [Heliorestis convoluta]